MCSTTEKSWFDPRPGQDIYFSQTRAYLLWRLPEPPINGFRGLFPGESGRAEKLTNVPSRPDNFTLNITPTDQYY
jgi:hypothetical protein